MISCLGGAAIRRRTRDRKVAGSTPGRAAISQLGQLGVNIDTSPSTTLAH